MRLKDKVAIVTGGGQGFGEGIVERFADEGCRVVVNDLNAETAERVAKAVNAKGGKAAAIQGDVSKDADWAKILKFALDTFGGLNIVVNNAGTTHRNQSMISVTEQDFDRVFAVNVKSLYHSAKHCVPARARAWSGTTAARARRSSAAAPWRSSWRPTRSA
jgi:3-oxoacyl-[acyl-carrier protein] reductase